MHSSIKVNNYQPAKHLPNLFVRNVFKQNSREKTWKRFGNTQNIAYALRKRTNDTYLQCIR